jgi:hypothetical protein
MSLHSKGWEMCIYLDHFRISCKWTCMYLTSSGCVCFYLLFLQNKANTMLSSCQINKIYLNCMPSNKNMYVILFFYFWEYLPCRDEWFIFDSLVRVLLVFYSWTYFQKIKNKSWFDLSIIRQKIVWVTYISI